MRALVSTGVGGSVVLAAALGIAAVAWYLGSPLFIRTTTDEAFPTAAATAIVVSTGGAAATQAAVASPLTIATGSLGYVDALHNGTGTVLLVRTGAAVTLRFENVAMTNAPDIHVYLSRETGGKWAEATSLYLGALKATNGSFNYTLPPDADVSLYKSAVIWCRQFSVLITWADLH